MLSRLIILRLGLGILAVSLLVCCGPHAVRQIHKLEMKRSPEHVIHVQNDMDKGISILPAPDATGEPIQLEPGKSTQIHFQLIELAELEESPHGWFRLKKGATTPVLLSPGKKRFLYTAGVDAAIDVKLPDRERHQFLVEFGDCWFTASSAGEEATLSIDGPPIAGVPAVTCP